MPDHRLPQEPLSPSELATVERYLHDKYGLRGAPIGVDGYSADEPHTMTLEDALLRVRFLRDREHETGRKQNELNAVALELAITALQNQIDREAGLR